MVFTEVPVLPLHNETMTSQCDNCVSALELREKKGSDSMCRLTFLAARHRKEVLRSRGRRSSCVESSSVLTTKTGAIITTFGSMGVPIAAGCVMTFVEWGDRQKRSLTLKYYLVLILPGQNGPKVFKCPFCHFVPFVGQNSSLPTENGPVATETDLITHYGAIFGPFWDSGPLFVLGPLWPTFQCRLCCNFKESLCFVHSPPISIKFNLIKIKIYIIYEVGQWVNGTPAFSLNSGTIL